MYRSARLLALASLWLALGCGSPTAPRRPSPAQPVTDKAALFGDPSLVPTREGERARQEVAQAAEIERAIEVLPNVVEARVDVELAERETTRAPRVLAVVRGAAGADETRLPDHVQVIARAVAGPAATVEVVVEASPAPAPRPEPLRWPLALGLLGLGFFCGMSIERARRLRRPSATRPRR